MSISPQVQNLAGSWAKVTANIQANANIAANKVIKPPKPASHKK